MLDTMEPNNDKPYIEEVVTYVKYKYNPEYGDDRLCICGHVYYRHFDSYEQMKNVGCKYCGCGYFTEDPDNRVRHLSRYGRNNVLIGDFIGLEIRYIRTYSPEEDVDIQIDCPDFFDHDDDLLYLYDKDQPYEEFKFNSDWNWLMPVVGLINDYVNESQILMDDWVRIVKVYKNEEYFLRNDIAPVYHGVVQYLTALKKYNKENENKGDIPKES